jgi:hypothetical protein
VLIDAVKAIFFEKEAFLESAAKATVEKIMNLPEKLIFIWNLKISVNPSVYKFRLYLKSYNS